jgi:hypothetical protein
VSERKIVRNLFDDWNVLKANKRLEMMIFYVMTCQAEWVSERDKHFINLSRTTCLLCCKKRKQNWISISNAFSFFLLSILFHFVLIFFCVCVWDGWININWMDEEIFFFVFWAKIEIKWNELDHQHHRHNTIPIPHPFRLDRTTINIISFVCMLFLSAK